MSESKRVVPTVTKMRNLSVDVALSTIVMPTAIEAA